MKNMKKLLFIVLFGITILNSTCRNAAEVKIEAVRSRDIKKDIKTDIVKAKNPLSNPWPRIKKYFGFKNIKV